MSDAYSQHCHTSKFELRRKSSILYALQDSGNVSEDFFFNCNDPKEIANLRRHKLALSPNINLIIISKIL